MGRTFPQKKTVKANVKKTIVPAVKAVIAAGKGKLDELTVLINSG